MVCPKNIIADGEVQRFVGINLFKGFVKEVKGRGHLCQMVFLERQSESEICQG